MMVARRLAETESDARGLIRLKAAIYVDAAVTVT